MFRTQTAGCQKPPCEANLSNFEGNGAELREVVGCALRVTPRRLRLLHEQPKCSLHFSTLSSVRLVTANNVEIGDADVPLAGSRTCDTFPV